MTAAKPVTPADHIARAKEQLANGVPDYAIANALIAIAESLQTSINEAYAAGVLHGGTATAEAIGTVMGVVFPGGSSNPAQGQS